MAAIAILVAVLLLPVLQIFGNSMASTLAEGNFVVSVKGSELKTGYIIAFCFIISGSKKDSSAESSVSTSAVSLDRETEEGSATAMEATKNGLLGGMSKGLVGGLIAAAAAAVVAIVAGARYLAKSKGDAIENLMDEESGEGEKTEYSFEDKEDDK